MVCVLQPAELRALAEVLARLVGLQDQRVGVVVQQVHLAAQRRHPEAVDHVRGRQLQGDGTPHRDVELVGRRDPLIGVADLPPPLVPDDLHDERFPWGGVRHDPHRIYRRPDHDEQDGQRHHHASRDDEPARRLSAWLRLCFGPSTEQAHREQHGKHDEHGYTEAEHQPPQVCHSLGDWTLGIETSGRQQHHCPPWLCGLRSTTRRRYVTACRGNA
jgi:hypothetical protein